MVLDSSAVLAVLLKEPEAQTFLDQISAAPNCRISAMSVLETATVLETRKGIAAVHELDALLLLASVEIQSFDTAQMQIAREAYSRYGKGRHPAKLNLGDCCSYALSKHSNEPLLFKGDDFSQTDIAVA